MSAIVIDVGARLIRREGTDVHLAPKAFELLLVLVRNRPNVVPHGELHAALWPGVHVSETSLAALVTQLRKAIGDTSVTAGSFAPCTGSAMRSSATRS
jgi:DNA-binding winged helix-turn-helix (wHTH) protein